MYAKEQIDEVLKPSVVQQIDHDPPITVNELIGCHDSPATAIEEFRSTPWVTILGEQRKCELRESGWHSWPFNHVELDSTGPVVCAQLLKEFNVRMGLS